VSARVAVCTDSSAHVEAGDGVLVVPVTVVVDGHPLDEPELDPDRFYEKLDAGAVVSTSQPSPGRFAEAYADAAAAGAAEVLSIHLDLRASGTAASAELAAREASLPVAVVDVGTVGWGVGRAVAAAAEAAATGANVVELAGRARAEASRLRNAFVAGGAPAGRIPGGDGLPLLALRDGETVVLGTCDGPEEAVDALALALLACGVPPRAAVGHAHRRTERWADALAARLEEAGVPAVDRYRVAPSVGAHAGPGCFGAFWERPG
jgi:fatty acid-binding protein DegV